MFRRNQLMLIQRLVVGVLAAVVLVGMPLPTWAAPIKTEAAGIARFIKIRWPWAIRLAPDGTLFFVHDPDGIRQLYKVPPGKTQSDAVKLTSFPDGIGGYNLSDDGKWIALTASVGGSEQSDLYLMNAATGKMETLFENPDVVYGGATWRRDSKAFAYRANVDSPADFHLYLFDLSDRSHKKIFEGKGHHYPADFNKEGTKLVFGKYHSAAYSQLFELTLDSGETREITPADERWSFAPIGFTADETGFLARSDYRGDLRTVYRIDLSSGRLTPVLSDLEGQEVDFARFNEDRTILAVGVNEEGYRTLHLRRASVFSPMPTPRIERGLVGNIDFTGRSMLYSLNNANTPGVVYRWNIDEPDAEASRLTKADTQGIDVSQFRLPKLVRYSSFDGTKIPAFVYLPNDYEKGKKIPFLVSYHGGPEAQYRPGFNRAFQYFVSRGFGIIAPNVRGSSGYGRTWMEADNYKNRHISVRDGVWAAKYSINEGYTEAKRIGALGGSYGGFMVMAAISEAPELFGAACNVVGVVNFETFLEQTKAYRRHLREAEYGPLSDREFLRTISPIFRVDKIKTPLMLAHGLNDPRVPVGEAMQIAVALKRRGMEVTELYFPDEGHGFAKEDNRLLYYEQLAKFFENHLK